MVQPRAAGLERRAAGAREGARRAGDAPRGRPRGGAAREAAGRRGCRPSVVRGGRGVRRRRQPRQPGGALQAQAHVRKHGIRRPLLWVSDSMSLCDTL